MKRIIFSSLSILAGAVLIILSLSLTYNINKGISKIFPDTIVLFLGIFLLVGGTFFISQYQVRKTNKALSERLFAWNKINPRIDEISEEVIEHLPVGIVVVDENERIAWINKYIHSIFGDNLIGIPATSLTQDFNTNVKTNEDFEISHQNKRYQVTYDQKSKVYYIFDITNLESYRVKCKDLIPAIGLIYLENMSDTLNKFDIPKQSSIKAEIFKAVGNWADKYGAYLRQYHDEKFVVYSNYAKLVLLEADKFSIIDIINEISKKNDIAISISLGFACWPELDLDDLGEYAQRAIDLALQRGGSQAAVNIYNKKMSYYGGKADSIISSTTRAQTRMNASNLKEYIEKASNVLVMGHINSDLDSFAACLIVKEITRSLNRTCNIILDVEKIDEYVLIATKELQEINSTVCKSFIRTEEAIKKMINDDTLLIVVDTHARRLAKSPELFPRIKNKFVIDHHRKNEDDIIDDAFTVIDPSVSSSVELCLELANYISNKIEFDDIQATIMYAAIAVDTSDFSARVSSQTFTTIARLIDYGADVNLSKKWLRKDLLRIQNIAKCVNKVIVYKNEYAIVNLGDEICDDRVFLSQVSEELLLINGIKASFTIAKNSMQVVQVSARSYMPTNVMLIMEKFSGGGHAQAAAVQLANVTPNEIQTRIEEYINIEFIERGDNVKVILLEDIKGRGKEHDVIEVAPGFAQYLISEQKAIPASKENISQLEKKKTEKAKEREQYIENLKKIASQIEGKEILISVQIGSNNKMFGSITSSQICEAFDNQYQIVFDKRKLEMPAINGIGTYQASVILDSNIEPKFNIKVISKKGE